MLLCAEYVLPITSDPIEAGAVLISEGRIRDIGPVEQLRARYANEEIRDFGQAAILPGFVNAHCHMEYTVLRGMMHDEPYATWMGRVSALSSTLNAADLYDSTLIGGLESVASGITCAANIASSEPAVRAMNDLGMRGIAYREVGAMDGRRVNYAMRQAIEDIESWRGMVDGDLLQIGIAPAPLYECHPRVFTEAAKYAADTTPLAMHVASSREEYAFIKYGRTPFSVDAMKRRGYMEVPPWLPTGATPVNYALNWGAFEAENVTVVHGVHVRWDDIQKLRQYGVGVAHCPRCNANLGMGVAPIEEYMKAGMAIGLGTDSPAATDSTDIFAEMRIGMMVQRAVSSETNWFISSHDLLEMATIGGARTMHIDDQVGSLEVGKMADIIAVDLSGSHSTPTNDPCAAVVNTATPNDVLMTMVGGKALYDQGKWNIQAPFGSSVAQMIKTRTRLRRQCADTL
ncbi:MAG: amidohydrolase family protein [Eggerthellaceae bacterium]|nr:amidohydrolase family protein [Eggerthellaceae bacterium]